MSMPFQSKGQAVIGNQCQEIGDRTGKATLFLMDKASHSRSPLVMVEPWSATMLCLLAGPMAKPSLVDNSLN